MAVDPRPRCQPRGKSGVVRQHLGKRRPRAERYGQRAYDSVVPCVVRGARRRVRHLGLDSAMEAYRRGQSAALSRYKNVQAQQRRKRGTAAARQRYGSPRSAWPFLRRGCGLLSTALVHHKEPVELRIHAHGGDVRRRGRSSAPRAPRCRPFLLPCSSTIRP